MRLPRFAQDRLSPREAAPDVRSGTKLRLVREPDAANASALGVAARPSLWRQAFQPKAVLRGLWRPRRGPDAALDGIRALSVLAVVWHHAVYQYLGMGQLAQPPELSSNWLFALSVPFQCGVDAFFVLSGFLITRQLLEEHSTTGGLSLKSFYRRRAFRILPLYFLVLLATLPSWPKPGNIVFNLFMVNNLLPIPEQVLPWSWSLAVEEQFYVFFPLAMLPVLMMGRRARVIVIGVATLGLGAWAFYLATRAGLSLPYPEALDPRTAFVAHDRYVSSLYLRADFRGAAILIGACLATIESVSVGRFAGARTAAGALGLALLVAFHTVPDLMGFASTQHQLAIGAWYSGRHFVYALAVGAVMFSLRGQGGLARVLTAMLGHRVFAGIARLTFALYLVHPMTLWLAYRLHPGDFAWTDFLGLTAVGLVIAVAISAALYAVVESPAMKLRELLDRQPRPAPQPPVREPLPALLAPPQG